MLFIIAPIIIFSSASHNLFAASFEAEQKQHRAHYYQLKFTELQKRIAHFQKSMDSNPQPQDLLQKMGWARDSLQETFGSNPFFQKETAHEFERLDKLIKTYQQACSKMTPTYDLCNPLSTLPWIADFKHSTKPKISPVKSLLKKYHHGRKKELCTTPTSRRQIFGKE